MSDTQQAVVSLTQNKLTEIEDAVINAFKPLINAQSVNSKSVDVQLLETEDFDDSLLLTASVTLKANIEAVDGFAPTYAEAIMHIDYNNCHVNHETNTLEYKGNSLEVIFSYGFYSYNLTWGVLNADGSMDHDNGEAFGIDSKSDDDMSYEVMGSILDLPNDNTDYQGFLQAIFNTISKQLSAKL